MKDIEIKRVEVVKERFGCDELNLVEVPFALLQRDTGQGQDDENHSEADENTRFFVDKSEGVERHWEIVGHPKKGLPRGLDESFYVALLALSHRDGFKHRRLGFSQTELLKIMGLDDAGHNYKRLEDALERLKGVSIYTTLFLTKTGWKRVRRRKKGMSIISDFDINTKTRCGMDNWFEWGLTLWEWFQKSSFKALDLHQYFKLGSPLSRRLYRFYDKRIPKSYGQREFELLDLAHEKLGLSRNLRHPSSIKRQLRPVLKEHIEQDLLSHADYIIREGKTWLTLTRIRIRTLREGDLEERLMELGLKPYRIKEIIFGYSPQIVNDWLKAMITLQPKNPPGFLIRALREKWALPITLLDWVVDERIENLGKEIKEKITHTDPDLLITWRRGFEQDLMIRYPYLGEFPKEAREQYITDRFFWDELPKRFKLKYE